MAKCTIYVIILVVSLAVLSSCAKDPYKTLSVTRSASQQEIKRAYKKLAREWHPDKSSHPDAADRFMQIQGAYEILSDDEKRREYDQFGYVDPNESNRRARDPFGGGGHGFHHFDFGSGGFRFQSNSGTKDPRRVTLARLQDGVFPQSHTKPYLILVTGSFCFNCMNVERIWADIAPNMEAWGVGVGTVNIDEDRRIGSALGIRYRPAIVCVLSGSVRDYGQGSISLKPMRDFVDGLLPGGLVQEVNNVNYKAFLASFYDENKPRVLLYSRDREVPLMYKLAALNFREFQTFGFASARAPNTGQVGKHVGTEAGAGSLLVYKENTDQHVDSLEERHMTLEALHHLLNYNKYLLMPRLSSQTMFEEMCPESPQITGRRLCIVQITKATVQHEPFRESFRQLAVSTPSWPHGAKLAYMLYESQAKVADVLEGLSVEVEHSVPVVVIWRQQMNQIKYAWMPDGWDGQEPTLERRAMKEFLYGLHDGTAKFTHKAVLPQFNDENAPIWIVQLAMGSLEQMKKWGSSLVSSIIHQPWDNNTILMVIFIVYMGFIVFAFFGLFAGGKDSNGEGEGNRQRSPRGRHDPRQPAQRRPPPQQQARQHHSVELRELRATDYKAMLDRQKSSWHLILLVRDSSRDSLCNQLSREVGNYPARMTFHVVCIDDHREWYQALVPGKEVGTVLAIRPSKKHYCEFNPSSAVPRATSSSSSSSNARRRHHHGNSGDGDDDEFDAGFLGLNESNEAGSDTVFSGILHWLDRLHDGALDKHAVDDWPDLQ